jgi:transcriptional regulator with XRE-family HTH domain
MPRKAMQTEFGRHLVGVRRSRGLSQASIARLAGVAPSYLSRIETGKVNPTVDTAARIAAAVRTSLDDLVLGPRGRDRRGACAVSRTGACMLDLARPEVGPVPLPGQEGYTPRQLKLIRKVTALVEAGSPDLLKALEVLVGQLSR